MGTSEQAVHTNRLRPLLEPPSEPLRVSADRCPPLFEHQGDTESPMALTGSSEPITTRSGHKVKPVNHYGDFLTF